MKNRLTQISKILQIYCIVLLTAGGGLVGANTPNPIIPQEIEQNQPQIIAIPVGKIIREAEVLENWITELRLDTNRKQENQQILEIFEKIRKDIQSDKNRFERALARRLTHDNLKSLSATWQTSASRIAEQVTDLEEQVEQFEINLKRIAQEQELWMLTLNRAKKESAPRTTTERTKTILDQLRTQNRLVKKQRNNILDYQNQAANLKNSVDVVMLRITKEQDKIETEVFTRQLPPIWRLSSSDRPELQIQIKEAVSAFSDLQTETVIFITANLDSIANYTLLVALLGWFLSGRRKILSRKSTSGNSQGTPPNSAVSIINHPWSAAVLLGALFSSFIFPGEPTGFKLLICVIGVPVWLRVIRCVVPTALIGPLVVIALIAMIDILRSSLGGFGLLNRTMLILIFLSALAVNFWFQRIRWRAQIRQMQIGTFWTGIISFWIRLNQLAVTIGFIAVLTGFILLADRLVFLVIWGSISGSAFLVLTRLFESVVQSMLDEHYFDRVRMIGRNASIFMRIARFVIRSTGFCIWFFQVFRGMQIWDPFIVWSNKILTTELGHPPVTFSIGDFLAFGLTLWVSWALARFLTFALDQEVFSRIQLAAGIPFAINSFIRYTILVVGFIASLGILGFPLDKITLLMSALGVGIGFGLQNITNNFISGIILLFERPIRVGDKVQLDELIGTVVSIGIRASKIRDFDGADVIVPNGDFISTRVTNWTLADQQRRIILPLHVAYGTEPRRVLQILAQVATDNVDVLESPAPEALFRGFGADALNFELRAWTESKQGWLAVMSDIALATSDAMKEAGITIPLPQRELTLTNYRLPQSSATTSHSDLAGSP